jgi:hypothetical protein
MAGRGIPPSIPSRRVSAEDTTRGGQLGSTKFQEGSNKRANRLSDRTVVRDAWRAAHGSRKCRPDESFAVGSDRVEKVVKLAWLFGELAGQTER